jgi:putative salt-induced outer membrane protein
MKIRRIIAATLLVLVPAIHTWADEAPPPPQDQWIGKGQFGFLNSHGNSDSESINGNIDLLRYDGAWKNELYVAGLYGKSSDIVSAERWETHTQSNYNFSATMFAFGGLRYEHDLFDGFQYQWSVTTGIGYKVFNTDANKLIVQAGVGYRRLRPEIIEKDPSGEVTSRTPLDATGNAIGTAGVDYTHAFNKTTTFTNKFLVESGSDNTLLTDALALTVKMSEKLALSAGYGLSENTKPPAPLKKLDTTATVNIVFSF